MILNGYERMVARRYLLPGKGEGFIFLVASISLLAVALGAAGEVDHGVDVAERSLQSLAGGEIGGDVLDAGVGRGRIGLRKVAAQDPDVAAAISQSGDDVASERSGASGDQDR